MKVLIVSHSCVIAGNQKKVQAIAKSNVDITLLVPSSWKEPLREIALEKRHDDDYRILESGIRFNGHVGGYFYQARTVIGLLRRKFDIIHIEEEPFGLAAFQFLALKRISRNTRFTLFTWENIFVERPFPRNLTERFVFNSVDAMICGNSEGLEVLRKKGYRGSAYVLPLLGVDSGEGAPLEAEKIRISHGLKDFFVVGFAGRLVREKGLLTLIEAMKGPGEGCRCLIVGKGPLKEEMAAMLRQHGMEDRFVFVDAVPHNEVARYISAMDCLVLPSLTTHQWKEQFGHVLIEAMANGVPVIGSSSEAIPEVIEDAGLVFKEGSAGDLGQKIKSLMDDEALRRSCAWKGRKRVFENYTHEKIAEKTLSIWMQCMK